MWKVGDRVQKTSGYKWPGAVVECTTPDVAGALHIYSPEQLVPLPPW